MRLHNFKNPPNRIESRVASTDAYNERKWEAEELVAPWSGISARDEDRFTTSQWKTQALLVEKREREKNK